MAHSIEEPKTTMADTDIEKTGVVPTAQDNLEAKEEEEQYPPWQRVAVIMIAVYFTMFIVALVRTSKSQVGYKMSIDNVNRTEQFLEQRFPKSRINSIPLTTSE